MDNVLFKIVSLYRIELLRLMKCVLSFILICFCLFAPQPLVAHEYQIEKEMMQEDLDLLLKEINSLQENNPTETIEFEKLLFKHHFKSKLSHLSFENQKMKAVSFKNISFYNVNFKNLFAENCSFQNVLFEHSDLFQARLIRSHFAKSLFMSCLLNETEFNWTSFYKTSFSDSDLKASVFNNASLSRVYFTYSRLSESTFLEAKVKKSSFIGCNLIDCLLCGTKKKFFIIGGEKQKITRPVIGLLYNFQKRSSFAKAMDESIKQCRGIVLRFHCLPELIDTYMLDIEVKQKLKQYEENGLSENQSIAQFVIDRSKSGSEIDKIKRYVAKAVRYIDGLVMPGGDDVEPEFFNEDKDDNSDTYSTYLRTIVEFSLIDLIDELNIPMLGICRGIQAVNVFFGGSLDQHCPEHLDVYHLLEMEPDAFDKETGKIAFGIMQGSQIRVLSKHHQVCKKVGARLDVVLKVNGHPELIISKKKEGIQYPNFILTQFHPELNKIDLYKNQDEFYNNHSFFINLVERAMIRSIFFKY